MKNESDAEGAREDSDEWAWRAASEVYNAQVRRYADSRAEEREVDGEALAESVVEDIAACVKKMWHPQMGEVPVHISEEAFMEVAGRALIDETVQEMVGSDVGWTGLDDLDNGVRAADLAAWFAEHRPDARVVVAFDNGDAVLWRRLDELPIKRSSSSWFYEHEEGGAECPVIEIDCTAAGLRVDVAY